MRPSQRRALYLYALALELAAIGGTDYTSDLTGVLLTDAQSLTCTLNQDQLMAAKTNLAFVNAENAGASVPATLAEKLEVAKCLVELAEHNSPLTDLVELLLICQLGIHKDYVQ